MVGAGAVVIKDVPPKAIVAGNPAKIIGYADEKPNDKAAASPPLKTKGSRLIQLPVIKDLRGSLCFAEIEEHLPFTPLRYFLIDILRNLNFNA
ncbi:MAG: WxcM-like domain-containing protein [Parachlamydia sp.]|jgi:hypothetical protein|nr:WxcM-like domain-containing protein [Parachlamydia sp.]